MAQSKDKGWSIRSLPSRSARLDCPSHPSCKWWVTATVMLGAFLVVVSGATVNVALPPIMTTFSMNLDEVQWVITAYMIASAVLIPTVGWLGNRLGNRNLFLLSLLTFISSSALCGLAWGGGRVDLFSDPTGDGWWTADPDGHGPAERGVPTARTWRLAMGLFGLAAAFGPAVGPVIGGYLTDYLSWRAVFYLNLVPGIVCMGLVFMVLRIRGKRGARSTCRG